MSSDYVTQEHIEMGWTGKNYHVRQYRPAWFTGFENEAVRNIPFEEILTCPWFRNFEHEGFRRFTFCEYGDELMISAHYNNGEHWVAGFAVPVDKPLAEDWRYNGDKIMKLEE